MFTISRACCGTALLMTAAMIATAQNGVPLPSEKRVALRTTSGYYLTAENGGGASVHTDRQVLGPWETFTLVPVSPGVFAFRADNGTFLTDLAGDQRGVREGRTMLGAMRRQAEAPSQFKVLLLNADSMLVAIVTSSGKYVTAENNGGVKARGTKAVSTDRMEIGAWEQFQLVDVDRQRPENRRQ